MSNGTTENFAIDLPPDWTLKIMHLPDRKKPVLVMEHFNEYCGHAVFTDEDSAVSFADFCVAVIAAFKELQREKVR